MVLYDTSVCRYEWPTFGAVVFSDCRVLAPSLLPSSPARAKPLRGSCSTSSLPELYTTYLNYLYVWWYIVVEFVPVAVALQGDKNERRLYEQCKK